MKKNKTIHFCNICGEKVSKTDKTVTGFGVTLHKSCYDTELKKINLMTQSRRTYMEGFNDGFVECKCNLLNKINSDVRVEFTKEQIVDIVRYF